MDEQTQTRSSGNKLMLPVSIVIAGVLIAGAIMYKPGQTSYTASAGDTLDATLSVDDDIVLGDANAPVTLIIFGDYQCPFCKKQNDEVESRLRSEYVDTGKVKMVFRDFPLENIHPEAKPAAIAAQCAGAQGKYWQYHDELFKRQDLLSGSSFNYELGAKNVGVADLAAFKACLTDPAVKAEVEKDLKDGVALGIRGTPASFIGNVYIEGAYPYEAFKETIEEQLKTAAE